MTSRQGGRNRPQEGSDRQRRIRLNLLAVMNMPMMAMTPVTSRLRVGNCHCYRAGHTGRRFLQEAVMRIAALAMAVGTLVGRRGGRELRGEAERGGEGRGAREAVGEERGGRVVVIATRIASPASSGRV